MPRPTVFLKSAVHPMDYPPATRPEVALVGRSNAGKSSLLNVLAGQKIAKVSQTPGKTRLLNFFDFGDRYRFVDMPGYGFASRHGSEVLQWQNMIAEYLENREVLKGIVLIMDARREWQEEEQWVADSCTERNRPLIIVLTKADKLSRSEQAKILKDRQGRLPGMIHLVSSQSKIGIDALEEAIYDRIVKGAQV